jgi:HSP20 family protein
MRGTEFAPVMNRMKEQVDRLFDRFAPSASFAEPMFPPFEKMGVVWAPSLDMTEANKEFIVRLEIPGVHKENLDVKLTGNLLTISGHREESKEGKDETFIWQEREAGTFSRSIRLPASVVEDKIEASYHDGLLRVHLPKVEPATGTKILIK